jgi:hypothetical protein
MSPSFWPIIVLIFKENSNLGDFAAAMAVGTSVAGAAEADEGMKAAPAAVPDAINKSRRLIFVIGLRR